MREQPRRDLEARFKSRYGLPIHDPRILEIAAPASLELDRDAQAKLRAYAKVRNFLIDKEREFAELLEKPVPEHPNRRIGDLPHDRLEDLRDLSLAFAAEDPLIRSAREAPREILSMFTDTFISAYGKLDQLERQIDPDELLRSRRDLAHPGPGCPCIGQRRLPLGLCSWGRIWAVCAQSEHVWRATSAKEREVVRIRYIEDLYALAAAAEE